MATKRRHDSPLFVAEDECSDSDSDTRSKRVKRSQDEETVDEEGNVPPYDISKETLPHLAVYHPSFSKAEGEVGKACSIITNTFASLEETGYKNDEIATVCGSAGIGSITPVQRLYPEIFPAAVLGPAGSGKSSAMNSIMHQKKAAFEHDGDERGTYVVHEYRSMAPAQTSRYLVKVPFYTEKDILRDIATHVKNINAFMFDDKDEDQSDADAGQERALQQKHDTAMSFFTDLLCDREEFESTEACIKFFEDHADTEEHVVIAELTGYACDYRSSRTLEDGDENHTAESENELHQVFKEVSRPQKAGGKKQKPPSPWPIIRKVIVHQDAGLLNSGVVLADTPGINDNNLAVVENTKRYLKSAGTVLIFLSYKRIDQNSPLDQLLRECVAQGKMHNTRLVITHIDEMKLSEDERDSMNEADQEFLTNAERLVKKLTKKIVETEAAKKKARKTDKSLALELDEKLEELVLEKARAQAQFKQASIQCRCRKMKERLQGRLRKIEKSRYAPVLPITFISNTQYQKHLDGYKPTEPPCLDVEATGIPELRRLLFAIPTRGKLTALQNIRGHCLPGLLSGIDGILTKSKLERKAEVQHLLTVGLGGHQTPVQELVEAVETAFIDLILKVMKKHEPGWSKGADKLVEEWSTINACTFQGICRRQGDWEGHRKLGDINFNQEILKLFSVALTNAFNELDDKFESIEKDFSMDIQDIFSGIKFKIQSSPDSQGQDLDAFFEFTTSIAGTVTAKMAEKFESLKESIAHIRHAATLDSEHSYSRKAMEKTYEECVLTSATSLPPIAPANSITKGGRKRRKAKSVHGNRLTLIHNRLTGKCGHKSIFQAVSQGASDDLSEKLTSWSQECGFIVRDAYDKIMNDFDVRYKGADVKQEEDPRAVMQLQQAVVRARAVLDGPLKKYLAECEAYELEGA